MPKSKISNEYISKCNDTEISEYPKYTTQVINLANQNAGGTRPRNVGQLSELLPEYLSSPGEASLSGWKEWYNERYPDAVNNAVDRVWDQVNNLRDCMDYIDKHILSRIFNDTCSPLPILSIVDLDMFVAFISWFFVISLSISNFTKVCDQMPYLSPLTEILSQQSEVPYRLFFVATARLVVERPADGRLSLSCVKVCTWVRTVPPVTGRW